MMSSIELLADILNLFQRIIFVFLFVASITQATAAAMMPAMEANMASMQHMASESAHCDSVMQSDSSQEIGAMNHCQMTENDCSQECHCCPSACSSVFIVSDNTVLITPIPSFVSSLLQVVVTSRQTSLYRPPISA